MTTDDAKPIIRTLRDVLLETRRYVELEATLANSGMGKPGSGDARGVLERVDGAITEADEVLS